VLFGAITIGAAPWYGDSLDAGCFHYAPVGSPVQTCMGTGTVPWGATVYWLVAVVLGYIATLAFYQWRSLRTGVAGRVLPYAAAGVALLAVAAIATPAATSRWRDDPFRVVPGDLESRGMTPLLVIALGLFVLAWLERSIALAVFAAGFFAVAMLSNLYDVENQSPAIGWTPSDQWQLLPNLWLSGFTLLLGGIGFGVAATLRARNKD
jgi:hypothetical protein